MAYKISKIFLLTLIPLFIFVVFFLATTNVVKADNLNTTYTLLEPLPCIPPNTCISESGSGGLMTKIDLTSFFQYAFDFLIAISAAAAVFMMVWGGFEYMTTDAWQKKAAGLNKFKNAIYGLLMVLSAFLILKTVNPKLVEVPKAIPQVGNAGDQISPAALYDKLMAQADVYGMMRAQDLKQVQDSLSKIKALEEENKEIQEKLKTIPDPINSPEILKIAQNTQAIQELKAKMTVDSADGLYEGRINNSLKAIDVAKNLEGIDGNNNHRTVSESYIREEFENGKKYINEQFSSGMDDLRKLNALNENNVNILENSKQNALNENEVSKIQAILANTTIKSNRVNVGEWQTENGKPEQFKLQISKELQELELSVKKNRNSNLITPQQAEKTLKKIEEQKAVLNNIIK